MAKNTMNIDIEPIIEELSKTYSELTPYITNPKEDSFKKGDFVECSYIKGRLYEVLGEHKKNQESSISDKVLVKSVTSTAKTIIGKKFLKLVNANKNTVKILYKS